MIREGMLAVALTAALPTIASAENVFVGTILSEDATAACKNSHDGDRHPSVYHPKSPGNTAFSGLSFIRGHYAVGHYLEDLAFDKTFRVVETGGVGWGNTFHRPEAQWAEIQLLTSVPATGKIKNSTKTVTITGKIKRLFNDPGGLNCVVTFRGTYVKEPFP